MLLLPWATKALTWLPSIISENAAQLAINAQIPVPGNTPAHYNGDPSTHLLDIEYFLMTPEDPQIEVITFLQGEILSDIGPNPTWKMTAWVNGTDPIEGDPHFWCSEDKYSGRFYIIQNDTQVCPPKAGPIYLEYGTMIPACAMNTGWYTVRVEIMATDGAVITDMNMTSWIEGAFDGQGWAGDTFWNCWS